MLSSGTALTSFSNFGSDSSGVYSDVWCEVWVQFYLFQLATTCLNIIYEIKTLPSAEKEREEALNQIWVGGGSYGLETSFEAALKTGLNSASAT